MNAAIRETSFGKMLSIDWQGERTTELLRFDSKGKPHEHDRWEHCVVLRGSGRIIIFQVAFRVRKGDILSIPPGKTHWMDPDLKLGEPFEILLWYSDEPVKLWSPQP